MMVKPNLAGMYVDKQIFKILSHALYNTQIRLFKKLPVKNKSRKNTIHIL